MKTIRVWIALALVAGACQKSEQVSELTGNQVTYALQQASQYTVSGSVTFKEKRDGTTLVSVDLSGTNGDSKYPVHLHFGDISTPGASIIALLNPIVGKTGKSETAVAQLADETKVSYKDLINLRACIKIHLSDSGPSKDVVLVAGNIGANSTNSDGRFGVAVCKSN